MKTLRIISLLSLFVCANVTYTHAQEMKRCRTGHIYIKSTNAIMNLEANNYQVQSQLNTNTGAITFMGLSKSFEWEKGALDQIFASERVDLTDYPKFVYEGSITNLSEIDFTTPGQYAAKIKGVLTIGNATRVTPATAVLTVDPSLSIDGRSDLSFKIEPENVERINKILESKTGTDMEQLKVSRNITVKAKFQYR